MKKVSEIKTSTYATGKENFRIDIVEHKTGDTQFDVWLYRENIGHKEYVYGIMRENNQTLAQVLFMTENYLLLDENFDGQNWYDEYDENYI